MNKGDIIQLYANSARVKALDNQLCEVVERGQSLRVTGLVASSLAVLLSALQRVRARTFIIILGDEDSAAYVFNDLEQGEFYPTSIRNRKRDAANEVLSANVLAKLQSRVKTAVVTYPDSLDELVIEPAALSDKQISVRVGQELDSSQLTKKLLDLGFERVDYVYEPGQFAVRGSLIDVFSYSSEYPYRIDLFGDDVDSLRSFEVESQLSRGKVESIEIIAPLGEGNMVKFENYIPSDALIVKKEGTTVMFEAASRKVASNNSELIELSFSAQPLFHKQFELVREFLKEHAGYKVHILSESRKQHERLKEILGNWENDKMEGVERGAIEYVLGTVHEGFIDHERKWVFLTDHQIFDRFHKYTLRSEKARSGKAALTMKELQELCVGDYVVHIDYGIGRFGGLVRKKTDRGYVEEIRIKYQRGDIVDLSIHSLYKIAKYRSNEGEAPRLSTLGTGAWERLKERTKQKIKDIARDLIKLYAKRRSEAGFAFSPDNFMQHELEASFLYEDTPDQIKATAEVKADMEAAQPMDRLICGDVGFGKTEVAVRAAFKAACDSKQVAVLVPTTILAFQHYQTFSKRLKGLPVRVEYLSRARSAKQTKQIIAELKEGKIDIIIGTHKLVGKDVEWHDLGLLIIDEEQKFGVSTKEKLRKLKSNVDTLTLTATPIPRTLQFSLLGARDFSIMRTPPPNRYPIQTMVVDFDVETIIEAISFELNRNGQVFFVNDRINKLEEIRRMIIRHLPDCRVAVGHGQMHPEELEEIVLGFINHDYDVLLSTTIVENGVDIQNANTIIINNAHHFGLSDLHQMRGRVGRSNRKAYCYLLAAPNELRTPEARRRLEALETFSELGSGFALAMQDLDIRGAGNLLGAEQSGFMEDLGYETYQKILTQAVNELKVESGELKVENNDSSDCTIESDLPTFFPDQYIPTSAERMLLYKELDNIVNDSELEAYKQRLIDRFGPVPEEGEELMRIVQLRRVAKKLGCDKIILRQNNMTLMYGGQKMKVNHVTSIAQALQILTAAAR